MNNQEQIENYKKTIFAQENEIATLARERDTALVKLNTAQKDGEHAREQWKHFHEVTKLQDNQIGELAGIIDAARAYAIQVIAETTDARIAPKFEQITEMLTVPTGPAPDLHGRIEKALDIIANAEPSGILTDIASALGDNHSVFGEPENDETK